MTKEEMSVALIKRCEELRLKAYLDTALIPTIAYGCTHYPNGIAVKLGDTCTEQEADEWLKSHLERHVYPLLSNYNVPDDVYSALASFVFNVGHLGNSLITALNNKDWDALAAAFILYDKETIDGQLVFSKGLYNRRQIEIKSFLTSSVWNSSI